MLAPSSPFRRIWRLFSFLKRFKSLQQKRGFVGILDSPARKQTPEKDLCRLMLPHFLAQENVHLSSP